MFTSPWAESLEDEEFFKSTILEVGKLLQDDVKLCVVYMLLLLTSQPAGSPLFLNSRIQEVHMEFNMLLYRYLCSTLGPEVAASKTHSLVGLLDNLHRCGDIIINKRIKMVT